VTERLWVVESLLSYRDETEGDFPSFGELIEVVSEIVPCDEDEAETRVWDALRQKEIVGVFDDGADLTLILGPHALTNAPRWLRNHKWIRREA
jgi:hypothetical protein